MITDRRVSSWASSRASSRRSSWRAESSRLSARAVSSALPSGSGASVPVWPGRAASRARSCASIRRSDDLGALGVGGGQARGRARLLLEGLPRERARTLGALARRCEDRCLQHAGGQQPAGGDLQVVGVGQLVLVVLARVEDPGHRKGGHSAEHQSHPEQPHPYGAPDGQLPHGPTIRTVDLVRSWLGQALRATGAAVVVPVAILVALSLTAVGGSGLGGLGGLSQVLSGPRAAGSDLAVDDSDAEIGDAVTQLAASTPGAPGSGVPGGTVPGTRVPSGPGGGGQAPDGDIPRARRRPGPRRGRHTDPAPPGRRRRRRRPRLRFRPRPGQPGVVDNVGRDRQGRHGRHAGGAHGRGCGRRAGRGLRPARLPPLVGAAFLPHLDRDLLDRQRDRRLRLGRADAHGVGVVARRSCGRRRMSRAPRAS